MKAAIKLVEQLGAIVVGQLFFYLFYNVAYITETQDCLEIISMKRYLHINAEYVGSGTQFVYRRRSEFHWWICSPSSIDQSRVS